MALRCFRHQINYEGSECPRCASEKQHKEKLESDKKIQEAHERGLRATAKALGQIVEYQEESNTQFQNIMSALGHTIDKVTDKVVFLEDKFDRYVKEEMITTEEVFTFGKVGGPLGQGKDCIEKYQLLPNGQLNLEHINHFFSPRLRPSFEEGIKQYKEQFKGPGLTYIQSQIEACVSKGFIQNKELGEQPKWEYANGNITIYYYQKNRVFFFDLFIRNENNIGHVPFQSPLESKCLDLATFEVEDEAHPLYAVSLLDGTVSLNEEVVALICREIAADFEHPIRRGLEVYVHALNDATRKQQRFLAIQNLQEKLQKEWNQLEQKRLAELERKRKEAEAKLERKRKVAEIMRKTIMGAIFLVISIVIYLTYSYFTSYEYRTSKYDYVSNFSEGLAQVGLNGKWGYVDEQGNEVVPPKYDKVGIFSDGLARVELNGKGGFVDMKGKEYWVMDEGDARKQMKKLKYDSVGDFSEGLAQVGLNGKWGYVDEQVNEVILLKYDEVEKFSESLAKVKLNGKWGLIDKTGEEVVPPKYDEVEKFSEGLAQVGLNGKWGYVDEQVNEVILLKYDEVEKFSEGLAKVKLNGKWGLIDKTGKEVVPLKYNNVSNFSEGLAGVKLNGKVGFIDKKGNEVITPKYEGYETMSFSGGLAKVQLTNGAWVFIDKKGNEYWAMDEDDARKLMKKR